MSVSPFQWTDLEVRSALALAPETGSQDVRFTGISTDSRSTRPGELYVALSGERFDGHDFVARALAAGAEGAVVSRPTGAVGGGARLYPVEDTLVALGRLASHRRQALPASVVGITGSSGKTGTKDLTAGALAGSLRVHATRGNLNNRVGVPLTLLSAPPDAQVVVAEMGTNEPGEIAILTGIARPDVGVVTTVGESHLEKLGSLEGVLAEKLALLGGLPPEGSALVGDTPPELPLAARRIREGARVAGWSERADPDLRPGLAERDPSGHFTFSWRGERVALAVPGRHYVANALLALAVAETLGVPPAEAARGVATVPPPPMRGEVRRLGGLTLLVDCYNANPQSVRAALDLLEGHSGRCRVAVLGTMLELGEGSGALHRRVLEDALGRDLELVVATGGFARAAAQAPTRAGGPGLELLIAPEPEDAYPLLRARLAGDEVVLLKASRGVALERLLPLFERDWGAGPGAPRGATGTGEG